MINTKKTIGAAVIGAVMLLPVASQALTVTIQDLGSATTVTLVDGLDDAVADGVISLTNLVVGGSSVSITSSFASETTGESQLTLNVTNALSGIEGLVISASHTGFGQGANAPQLSSVSFDFNASDVGAALYGSGYADDGDGLFATTTLIGGGAIGTTTDVVSANSAFGLTDPFSLTSVVSIGANSSSTSFDATIIAAVPLPAAGLMFLTALGGLGLARRRRKSA